MQQLNILDKNLEQLKRHCVFNFKEQYDANALWIAGTYFLQHAPRMKVASFFPMFGYVSPEPDSGKTTALDVTNTLSYNSFPKGKMTPALILSQIDNNAPDKITIALDELDKVFAHGKDNEYLISLFNLGYGWNNIIGRMKRFRDGSNITNAFCPKVFAALSMATIPADTKTRCLFIHMRPRGDGDAKVPDDIDYDALHELQADNLEWSHRQDVIDSLTNVEFHESDIAFLTNRNRQLWRLMLAIAKTIGDGWYERGLEAARFFTERQEREKGLYHKILVATYRIIHDPMNYDDSTHSETIVNKLQEEFGLPKYIDANYIAKCYREYDQDITPQQVKIRGINLNGYKHYKFDNIFRIYRIDREVEEVDRVDALGHTPANVAVAACVPAIGSTGSTTSTDTSVTTVTTVTDPMDHVKANLPVPAFAPPSVGSVSHW